VDLYEAIMSRRSIRSYEDKPVPEDVLRRVLEAGRAAPSARNMQEWKFVVVRDAEVRMKLSEAANGQKFVAEAPVVIAACSLQSDYVMTCGHPAHLIDIPIAVDHMTLAAAAEGLGTCWIGAFHQDKAKEALGIPEEITVVSLLPLGYPAESPAPRPRKSFEETFAFDYWT